MSDSFPSCAAKWCQKRISLVPSHQPAFTELLVACLGESVLVWGGVNVVIQLWRPIKRSRPTTSELNAGVRNLKVDLDYPIDERDLLFPLCFGDSFRNTDAVPPIGEERKTFCKRWGEKLRPDECCKFNSRSSCSGLFVVKTTYWVTKSCNYTVNTSVSSGIKATGE